MESCRLPIELCESTMDELVAWDAAEGPSVHRSFIAQGALCACALTCRAWRPRAQLLLWKFPILESGAPLAAFADLVGRAPYRTHRAFSAGITLYRGGNGAVDAEQGPTGFMRGLHTLFAHAFPGLRLLRCRDVPLSVGPHLLRRRLPFFAHISTLALTRCEFDSTRALLDLVWSCRSLAVLHIDSPRIKEKAAVGGEGARLSAACAHLHACQTLAELELKWFYVPPVSLFGSAFGSALTELTIHIDRGPTLATFLTGSFPLLARLTVKSSAYSHSKAQWRASAPSWLAALAASRAASPSPSALRSITLERAHDLAEHECCRDLVAHAPGALDGPGLAGVDELWFVLAGARDEEYARCARYMHDALPGLRGVLRFRVRERSGGVWEYRPSLA